MPQQDHLTARLVVDDDFEVAPVNNRLFGSFVEHLGRCVYTGIYEPDHPTADEHGFRKDVIDLVKELGATTIRYPGGNFVSGYRWEDGIGPKQERPRRLDLAWHSTETNEFGLHEMAEWLEATGGNELMEAVNLGTRGLQEALDLLEYANVPGGTELSERRRANGADKPFDIQLSFLGNEMQTARGSSATSPPMTTACSPPPCGPPACARSIRTWNWWCAAPPPMACRPSASGSIPFLRRPTRT